MRFLLKNHVWQVILGVKLFLGPLIPKSDKDGALTASQGQADKGTPFDLFDGLEKVTGGFDAGIIHRCQDVSGDDLGGASGVLHIRDQHATNISGQAILAAKLGCEIGDGKAQL